jgi:16S rRNA (guanine527-N7)-methyltransferase
MFHVKHDGLLIPEQIRKVLRENGFPLNERQIREMGEYVSLLLEWNEKINMISRRDSDRVWESHILHSVSPLFLLDIPSDSSILDLGSGGGLPGIPLSILHRGLSVTLMDSIQKKTRVLEEIVQCLGLPNLRVLTGRAEELGREGRLRGTFDAVIARAVAPLADLASWSKPFLRRRTPGVTRLRSTGAAAKSDFSFPYLLALKGGDLEKEVRDVRLREKGITITEIALSFPGSELLGLVDKKLVLIEWPD